jgi:predicted metal-dependent hydrolase
VGTDLAGTNISLTGAASPCDGGFDTPETSAVWDAEGVAIDLLPVRRTRFEYPDDFDPLWSRSQPEFAAAANAISLGMPYAEPLFIRAMRMVIDDLDPQLRATTETYIRQEVGHYMQHKRLNDLVSARYTATSRLQRWMDGAARWVSRRSKRLNVAYAVGGETLSYGVARWTEAHPGEVLDDADPIAATLFLWHLAEEVEHKSATYDVFEATDGSRLRYAVAMLAGFSSLSVFTVIGALMQLRAERRLRYPATWYRLLRLSLSAGFTLLPLMLVSALPGHTPRDLVDPTFLRRWIADYDEATGTLPLYRTDRRSAA